MSIGEYKRRRAEHVKKRSQDLTYDPRAEQYTEVSDDADWLRRDSDGDWGADDSHNDVINFCPSDAGLIEWRCGQGRKRWLARAESYLAGECPEYGRMIKDRVAELDARFGTFGR